MRPDRPDALLFDLGRVVVDIDLNRVFASWVAHASCDPALLRSRFSVDATYMGHETGAVTDAEFFANLRTGLGIDLTDAQFLEGWNAIFVGEMPGIAALLARAASKLPLYVFSNTNPAHEQYWSVQFADVLRHFRKLYVSSTIRLRKPDAAAFAHVVKDIGVPAERIVFFDDVLENVEGARASGLGAVHVQSTAEVEHALAAMDI